MKARQFLSFGMIVALGSAMPAVCNGQTAVRTDFTVADANPEIIESDFSTPWAAVETMIRAAKAKNVEVLAECFTDQLPEAFVPYRDGSASDRQLDTLADWAWEAAVIDVEMESARDAWVSVRYHPKQRPWMIQAVRTPQGWRIGAR